MKNRVFNIMLGFLSLLLFLFIVVPLLKIVLSSKPEALYTAFKDPEVLAAIFLSLKCSFIAALIALVTGVPLAYLLSRKEFPGKAFIEAIIDIPVMIPHTAAGIALLTVFGNRFFIGKFLRLFGFKVAGTEVGIVLGMLFISLSYLVSHSRSGFDKIDVKLENVAESLGASRGYTFFKILLPLARRDITRGFVMMWARGISEFGAVVILTYHPMTAPILILDRFQAFGLKYSQPIAVIMIVLCILIFTLIRMLNNKKSR